MFALCVFAKWYSSIFLKNLVGIENVNYWFKSCIGCDRGSICLSDCVVQAGF